MTEIEIHRGLPATTDWGLSEGARRRIVESVPESTRSAYEGDWRRYRKWCVHSGRPELPTTPAALAEYVNYLADNGRAPSTINRAIAAIVVANESAGLEKPGQKPARAVLRRYQAERADAGYLVKRATALSVKALRAMVAALDTNTAAGVRDRAVLVLGFALGARRAEIAALDISDLDETEEGWLVHIRRSKTDRESVGRDVAVLRGSQPDTCPVGTVRAWLDRMAVAGRTAGPLFVRIDRHGNLGRAPRLGSSDGRLSGQAIAVVVARTARAAGLPAFSWSGHSLRRGLATAAYGTGANPLRIARHGGWRDGSSTLLRYIEEVDRWTDNPLRGIGL